MTEHKGGDHRLRERVVPTGGREGGSASGQIDALYGSLESESSGRSRTTLNRRDFLRLVIGFGSAAVVGIPLWKFITAKPEDSKKAGKNASDILPGEDQKAKLIAEITTIQPYDTRGWIEGFNRNNKANGLAEGTWISDFIYNTKIIDGIFDKPTDKADQNENHIYTLVGAMHSRAESFEDIIFSNPNTWMDNQKMQLMLLYAKSIQFEQGGSSYSAELNKLGYTERDIDAYGNLIQLYSSNDAARNEQIAKILEEYLTSRYQPIPTPSPNQQ